MSSNTVESFISSLEPGDTVDVNNFEELHGTALKRQLLDELEGLGFVLDSRGTLGEVSICSKCSGDGGDTKACHLCDDYGVTVDYGRGIKPFKE
jgi:hypothetical protein